MKSQRFRIFLGVVLPVLFAWGARAEQQAGNATQGPTIQLPQAGAVAPPPPPAAYSAVGSYMVLASHLNELGWNEAQISAFIEGVRASFQGRPFPINDDARKITDGISQQVAAIEAREKEQEFAKPGRLNEYMREISKRLKLEQSDSGLCYGIEPGASGVRPGPGDSVVIACAAFAADGATPIQSLTTQKALVKVSGMLPGFVEGIQMMNVGSNAIFVLPPALSFGSGKWPPGVDRGTPLIFKISLVDVVSGNSPH